MSSEHTKGSWRMKIDGNPNDEDYSGEGIFIQVQNKDGTWADIGTVTFYGNSDCNADIDLANARLIAAAPDLLQACKDLLEFLKPRLEAEGGIAGCRENNLCVVCKAKATVAKASNG